MAAFCWACHFHVPIAPATRSRKLMKSRKDFHLGIGALQVGLLLSVFLHGIVTMQTYKYYCQFPNDPRPIRCFVITVWILECAHSALSSHFLHSMAKILTPDVPYPLSLVASVFVFATINALIQAYFAYRAWSLMSGRLRILPILCWTICLFRFVVTSWIGGGTISLHLSDAEKRFGGWGAAGMLTGPALDLVNSALLCYCLWTYRKTGFHQTRRIIKKTISVTIQTGGLTSIMGCIMSICFLGMGNNQVWLGIHFVVTKLYSISLLMGFNLRAHFSDEVHDVSLPSVQVSKLEFATPTIDSRTSSRLNDG